MTNDIQTRTLLIEAAHGHRFPTSVARRKLSAMDAVPEALCEIVRKAQTRLSPTFVPTLRAIRRS
jgi:hypothetical protein